MADPELTAWCRLHGVIFNGIEAAYVSEGWRGIVATMDLLPDDIILRVPEPLLLTTASANRDPTLAAALPHHPHLSPHQILATHLLHEVSKGPSSFWWPYLRQLPRSYTSLAHFAEGDVEALQFNHARDAAEAAGERARADWFGALPLLQDLGLPKRLTNRRAWLWAASTLHSRTMHLPWCPAGALTPYGDLHNYQSPPAPYMPQLGGCTRFAVEQGGVQQEQLSSQVALKRNSEADAVRGLPELPHVINTAAKAKAAAATLELSTSVTDPTSDAVLTAAAAAVENAATVTVTEAMGRAALGNSSEILELGPSAGTDLGGGVLEPVALMQYNVTMGLGNGAGGDDGAAGVVHCVMENSCQTHGHASGGGSNPSTVPYGGSSSTRENVEAVGKQESQCTTANEGARDCTGGASGDFQQQTASDECTAEGADGTGAIAGDGKWDEVGKQYCIIVRRPFRRGEQVMLCYGRYTNLELLEHYGFVLEDNPHDKALLDPELLPLPPNLRTAPAAPYLAPSDCFLHANSQPGWQLLQLLRYCAATPTERRTLRHVIAAGERVSEEGDRQALRWLHQACSAQLAALPTSLQEDLQMQADQMAPAAKVEAAVVEAAAAVQTELPPEDTPLASNHSTHPQTQPHRKPHHNEQLIKCNRRNQQQSNGNRQEPEPSPSPPPPLHQQDKKLHESNNKGRSEHARIRRSVQLPGERQQEAAVASSEVRRSEGALSDGLNCHGLALHWRVLQKRILRRAVRHAEAVLAAGAGGIRGLGLGGGEAGGRPVLDLTTLMRRQRQGPQNAAK